MNQFKIIGEHASVVVPRGMFFMVSITDYSSMTTFPYKFHLPFSNILVPVLLFVLGYTTTDFLPRARVYCLGHWVQCWNSISTVMLLLLSSGRDGNCFEYRSKGSELLSFGTNVFINVTWFLWTTFAVRMQNSKQVGTRRNSYGVFICSRDRNRGGRTWFWSTDLHVQFWILFIDLSCI
jgi:hypothetical protein